MRTAWAAMVAKIFRGMPTLKKGSKLGLTHAGLSTWEPPVFTGTPSSSSQAFDEMKSSSKQGTRARSPQHRKPFEYTINDLPSDEDDDEDDLSFHSSSMSEEPRRRVRPDHATFVDKDYIQELLAEQELRFQNRLDQLLSRILPTNNIGSSTVMEEDSQSGGSHSNLLHNT